MNKKQVKDVAVRAGKTFLQAALAFAVVNYVTIKDRDTLKTFGVGVLAAGLSALWNVSIVVKENK